MPLDIEIKAQEEKAIIKLPVKFDMNVADNFRDAICKLPGYILNYELDMGNTEYMDAAALGSLMLLKHEKSNARKIEMINCNAEIYHLLMLMDYDRVFDVVSNGSELQEKDNTVHVA